MHQELATATRGRVQLVYIYIYIYIYIITHFELYVYVCVCVDFNLPLISNIPLTCPGILYDFVAYASKSLS
jgi:hypothetical protein